jgi:ribose 5-phosphate isomerase A
MRQRSELLGRLQWQSEITNREAKQRVAERIAAELRDGDVVGLGSGSTSLLALQALTARAEREGLRFFGIPTSFEVQMACATLGVQTRRLVEAWPDWYFDGADEVDPGRNLIKGRGGAMFQEKLILRSSARNFILVDQGKLVERLGLKFAIPVEVHPLALRLVEAELRALGATEIELRHGSGKDGPVLTEAGNLILDVRFGEVGAGLEREIKSITGVLESGLFQGYAVTVLTPD